MMKKYPWILIKEWLIPTNSNSEEEERCFGSNLLEEVFVQEGIEVMDMDFMPIIIGEEV